MQRVIKKVRSVNDLHIASEGRLIMQHFYLLRFIARILKEQRAEDKNFRKYRVKTNHNQTNKK